MRVTPGSTNVTTYFKLRNTSNGQATTGATITALDLTYVRSGAAPAAKVDATALAATDSVHADNKAIEVDATNQPGLYRVDWPDAAFAAGVREVILTVVLASSFAEDLRVELSTDVADVVTAWRAVTPTAGAVATYDDMMLAVYAAVRGQVDKTGSAYAFLDDDDLTTLFTLTLAASQRATS